MAQRVTIKIETGNAAFTDGNEGYEVARILRTYADRIDGCSLVACKLLDINGNTVGSVTVTGKADQ